MSHEFNEAEMMPCDLCGEFWPGDEMYELEDGRICCPDCLDEMTPDED
ncbi:MAG: hypothetical protein MJZ17_05915 [Bacteroidales bacterium]|nr:hypothetical protein [Bacteroidales bacterium]